MRPTDDPHRDGRILPDIALLFLKLGTIAFGGPAAHIAMMEDEVVRKRRWLERDAFLDLIGAANLVPGPNSTELAIHIGYRKGGWSGLILAGACFILPSALIVTLIAWFYVRFGQLPELEFILYGIKPVVIAIVLQALWALARTAVKGKLLAVVGLTVVILSFAGLDELALLFAAGAFTAIAYLITSRALSPTTLISTLLMQAVPSTAATFSLWSLFLFFLKVGSVLFGSGYVLLAFLRADLVERWSWLTNEQLLDAIAVGQITPGPVFTTATFIGYVLGGGWGALVATVGIFLPAFVFVSLSGWLVPRLRRSKTMSAFLDGINVASLALMAYVTFQLGRSALIDAVTTLIAGLCAVLLIRFKVNSVWLIAGGAMAGLCAKWISG